MFEEQAIQPKSRFSVSALALSMLVAGAIQLVCKSSSERRPSNDDALELSISQLNIPQGSIFKGGHGLYLRATFNQQMTYEWGKTEGWALSPGEKRPLDIVLKVPNNWIQNDELEFKLEVMQNGGIHEAVMVRCAQVSKQLSSYNRGYQCNVPGDNAPLLSYRLGRKVEETLPVAQTAGAIKSASNR